MARAETSSKQPSPRCVLVATRCSRGQTLRDKIPRQAHGRANVIQLQDHLFDPACEKLASSVGYAPGGALPRQTRTSCVSP
jgi:hypothetical protein